MWKLNDTLAIALTASFLAATSLARAGPAQDANAGLDALNAGNDAEAVRLFTRALQSGKLSRSDRELALVKRAEAHLGAGNKDAALADAKQALALAPDDSEATEVRDKAGGAAEGPSLADTLAFIKSAIEQQPTVNYTLPNRDTNTNNEASNSFSDLFSNVTSHADQCILSFHVHMARDGAVILDKDAGIPFNTVSNVIVRTVVDETNLVNAEAGSPNIVEEPGNPPIWAVRAMRTGGAYNGFVFYSEDIADRVAKAMEHAAALCGGMKQPF